MADDLKELLAKFEQAGRLDELRALLDKESPSKTKTASVEGSGAVATHGGTAAGEGSVIVEGDVYGGVQLQSGAGKTPASLRESYLSWVLSEARRVPLAGIDPRGVDEKSRHDVDLGAIYTDLMTRTGEADEGFELPDAPGHRPERQAVSALQVLDREPRLALLGDPGSGKSTFVNFVAMCLAGDGLDNKRVNLEILNRGLGTETGRQRPDREDPQKQAWTHGPLLPVRVILRDFAAQELKSKGFKAADALWKHIRRQLPNPIEDFADDLHRELMDEGGLVLLDGLDEVPEAEKRRQRLIDSVHRFAACFPKARILVTSRTYAYQREDWKLDGFAATVLAPFSDEQIEAFVNRWYDHIGPLRGMKPSDAKGRAALLNRAMKVNKSLRELAERPLLLTLMASLHAWRDELPEKREQLYHSSVELLLHQWEQKKLERTEQGEYRVREPSLAEYLKSDKEALRRVLNQLAFEAHRDQEKRGASAADISQETVLTRLLRLNPKASPGLLAEYLNNRAGLLVPRGASICAFPHRSFQEYLAACHCTEQPGFPDDLADLAMDDLERWREVMLLAAAKAAGGAPAQLWPIVDSLCPADLRNVPESKRARAVRGALLAGQSLAESGNLEQVGRHRAKLDRVRGWLVHTLRVGRLSVVDRARAGVALAKIGDPRAEVTTVDGMEFCWVPGGPFWMGDPEAGKDADNPLHRNESLPDDFWMGRFPVSVSQFEEFVQDGGYRDASLWPEARERGVWSDGHVQERVRPYRVGEPYELSNHPVVGVTWYEALAFARWLQARWRKSGLLPDGWRVSLPSESEWEKAARGGERVPKPALLRSVEGVGAAVGGTIVNELPKRSYPWGEWDAFRLNFAESGIGTTSALGCFPAGASPSGCEEMAGNVWEWTRSQWGKGYSLERRYPYDPADGRERLEGEATRVRRGGSYWNEQSGCSCSARYRLVPVSWYVDIGFRVALSPSLDSDRL